MQIRLCRGSFEFVHFLTTTPSTRIQSRYSTKSQGIIQASLRLTKSQMQKPFHKATKGVSLPKIIIWYIVTTSRIARFTSGFLYEPALTAPLSASQLRDARGGPRTARPIRKISMEEPRWALRSVASREHHAARSQKSHAPNSPERCKAQTQSRLHVKRSASGTPGCDKPRTPCGATIKEPRVVPPEKRQERDKARTQI